MTANPIAGSRKRAHGRVALQHEAAHDDRTSARRSPASARRRLAPTGQAESRRRAVPGDHRGQEAEERPADARRGAVRPSEAQPGHAHARGLSRRRPEEHGVAGEKSIQPAPASTATSTPGSDTPRSVPTAPTSAPSPRTRTLASAMSTSRRRPGRRARRSAARPLRAARLPPQRAPDSALDRVVPPRGGVGEPSRHLTRERLRLVAERLAPDRRSPPRSPAASRGSGSRRRRARARARFRRVADDALEGGSSSSRRLSVSIASSDIASVSARSSVPRRLRRGGDLDRRILHPPPPARLDVAARRREPLRSSSQDGRTNGQRTTRRPGSRMMRPTPRRDGSPSLRRRPHLPGRRRPRAGSRLQRTQRRPCRTKSRASQSAARTRKAASSIARATRLRRRRRKGEAGSLIRSAAASRRTPRGRR